MGLWPFCEEKKSLRAKEALSVKTTIDSSLTILCESKTFVKLYFRFLVDFAVKYKILHKIDCMPDFDFDLEKIANFYQQQIRPLNRIRSDWSFWFCILSSELPHEQLRSCHIFIVFYCIENDKRTQDWKKPSPYIGYII